MCSCLSLLTYDTRVQAQASRMSNATSSPRPTGVRRFQMPSESEHDALILATDVLIFSCVAACKVSKTCSHWTSALGVDSLCNEHQCTKWLEGEVFSWAKKGLALVGRARGRMQGQARCWIPARGSSIRPQQRKRQSPANHSQRRCTWSFASFGPLARDYRETPTGRPCTPGTRSMGVWASGTPSHLMIVFACLTPIKTTSCSASNSPSKSFQAERQSPQISLNLNRRFCAMSQ
jgi:hypothetical protein